MVAEKMKQFLMRKFTFKEHIISLRMKMESIDDYFFAINDFKNITLDLKTVKQKPIELFHYYTTWETATNLIKLNNFVGSPINFDNPLIFDI